LLEEAVEEKAVGPRRAPVEPESKLVEIVRELSLRDAPLIRPEEPPLHEGGYAVRTRQEHMS
jgi:hypothetical protein